MPLLAELKGAGQTALAWLWDWYWSHLESAFNLPSSKLTEIALTDTDSGLTAKLQNILRTYIKSRKSEIKTKRAPDQCTAARDALSTYSLRFSSSATILPSNTTQDELLRLLVHDKQILPQDKKIGSSMSGAFLIWSPLLLAFCAKSPTCFQSLLDKVIGEMSNAEESSEAQGEGMCEWAAHMLTSSEWAGVRKNERAIREKVLGDCMTELGVWHLRLAEKVVDAMGEEGALWRAILHAEHSGAEEETMVLDRGRGTEVKSTKMDAEVEVETTLETLPLSLTKPSVASRPSEIKEKIIGPQKVIGLWKSKPIGWLPQEWDEDD